MMTKKLWLLDDGEIQVAKVRPFKYIKTTDMMLRYPIAKVSEIAITLAQAKKIAERLNQARDTKELSQLVDSLVKEVLARTAIDSVFQEIKK